MSSTASLNVVRPLGGVTDEPEISMEAVLSRLSWSTTLERLYGASFESVWI